MAAFEDSYFEVFEAGKNPLKTIISKFSKDENFIKSELLISCRGGKPKYMGFLSDILELEEDPLYEVEIYEISLTSDLITILEIRDEKTARKIAKKMYDEITAEIIN